MTKKHSSIYIILLSLFLFLFSSCGSDKPISISEEGYLTGADGAQLYYRVTGKGQDSIVVVHGGPGAGMHSILPSVEPLAKQFVLILYDQRGGGRSTLPEDTTKLKPRYYVEDLEAVRTHFGLDQMNILTHSFGAVLVAEYAQTYADHLNRVVFHGATGPELHQELDLRREKSAQKPPPVDTTLSNRASKLLRELLKGTSSTPVETCREYERINRQIAQLRGDTLTYRGTTCDAPPEAVRYYYRYTAQLAPRYYGEWDYTSKLDQLESPLLVVYGKEDSLMIRTQRAWASAVPNGRLLLAPDAGKPALSENPDFVLPSINTFFEGDWPEESN